MTFIQAMTTGLAALVGLKAAKNLLTPPLTLTIDSHQHEEVFDTTTLFGTEVNIINRNDLLETGANLLGGDANPIFCKNSPSSMELNQ